MRRRTVAAVCAGGALLLSLHRAAAEPDWAHPSPYDAAAVTGRFANVARFSSLQRQWDLPGLVSFWKAEPHQETWPWLWCQRNPTGPHHVFIGFNKGTLAMMQQVSRSSSSNNLTLILHPGEPDPLRQNGVSEAQVHQTRCAIVRVPVAQFDVHARTLMLDDERIIEFDEAHMA